MRNVSPTSSRPYSSIGSCARDELKIANLVMNSGAALVQGEAKLMLKREDSGGLNVSLKQLNAVLRI